MMHDVDNDVEIVKFDDSHASDILAVPGSALSSAGCFDCVAGLHGHGAWSSALSLSPQFVRIMMIMTYELLLVAVCCCLLLLLLKS